MTASTIDVDLKKSEEAPGSRAATEDDLGAVTNIAKEAENYYLTGSKLAILMTGMCLALFLIGLDTAIVSTVRKARICVGEYKAD